MHDGRSEPGPRSADDTFQGLRADFLEDAAEDLDTLLSYLNEAIAGNRPAGDVLVDARRTAVTLAGGAGALELPLVGVAAQRLDDYVASMTRPDPRSLRDLAAYAETLIDLLADPDSEEESASALMRRLPAKGGDFSPDEVVFRDIEVLLIMAPGVVTRLIERELQECGYRVTTAGHSYRALELAARTVPDLVIVSAVMPDLSGIDLAIALKAMPATRNIGVAVITSLDPGHPDLQQLPPTVPIIKKGASFGDDLAQALQDQFLL